MPNGYSCKACRESGGYQNQSGSTETAQEERINPNPCTHVHPTGSLARRQVTADRSILHSISCQTTNEDLQAPPSLRIIPVILRQANDFIIKYHRHHKPSRGAKFAIGLTNGSELVGVVLAGRPIARMSDNGVTIEVTRCCTNGVYNGCSMLYRAAWRAAKAMGYTKMITYTLPEEGGGSLRAAGFRLIGECGGGSWSRPSRGRKDEHPIQRKLRWEIP